MELVNFPILVVVAADHVKRTVTFSKLVVSLGHCWNMQRNSGSQSNPTRILSLQVSEKKQNGNSCSPQTNGWSRSHNNLPRIYLVCWFCFLMVKRFYPCLLYLLQDVLTVYVVCLFNSIGATPLAEEIQDVGEETLQSFVQWQDHF